MSGMAGHERPNKGFTDDWWTPLDIVESLGHFDLDPCGNKSHPTCREILEINGLETNWSGRVWMNPPYSENSKWVDRFIDHRNGVALLFARTDTRWCQNLLKECDHVYFIAKRIKFLKSGADVPGTSGAPSALFYFGDFYQPSRGGVRK